MERRNFIKTGTMAAAGAGLTAMNFPLFRAAVGVFTNSKQQTK